MGLMVVRTELSGIEASRGRKDVTIVMRSVPPTAARA